MSIALSRQVRNDSNESVFYSSGFCITNLFYNFLATDWYFILHNTEAIYCTSKTEYRISLTEDALKDSTDLHKNVKRILEVIVGLLKDRVSASKEPANKKRRVEEIIKKKIIV